MENITNKKCQGCGIVLQNENINIDGYVANLDNDYCLRCFKINNYNEVMSTTMSNKDYQQVLNNISSDDLVIYVSSLLNLNLLDLKKFKRVLLVLTKRDLLPKSVNDKKVINKIKGNNSNILDIEIISSLKNYHLDELYTKIRKFNNTNKVYFVGKTNSGKSSLLNQIIKNYSSLSPKITTSIYPSTTLNKISIMIDEIEYIDTPGIVDSDNITNYLSNSLLKKVNGKKEIKPRTFQVYGKGSIVIEDILQLNYNSPNSITIYCSNLLKVTNNKFIDNNSLNLTKVSLDDNQDIVIEDVCFIKVTKSCNLEILLHDNIKFSLRDNLI